MMNKILIIIFVILTAVQLSACTIKATPGTQAIPEATQAFTTGVITTTNVTSNSTPTQTASPVPTLTVEQVKYKMESDSIFVLIDVRSKADYDKSHIVGAVSIPIEELSRRYTEIPRELEIIIYGACT